MQQVQAIYFDCDADTLLLKVNQIGGAACHEGYESCFFREVKDNQFLTIESRVVDPKTVYGSKG